MTTIQAGAAPAEREIAANVETLYADGIVARKGAFGREWAEGFFLAVEPVREAWEAWLDAEDWIEEIFVMLEELASGELAVEPGEAPEPLPYRDRLDTIGALPGMLADLHAHRIEHLTPREPVRRAATPGRNDPCPCGSGRKFKVCCGAN